MQKIHHLLRLALGLFAVVALELPAHAQIGWNQACAFNGTNYIAIPASPSLNLTSSFVIEAWVKTTTTGTMTVIGKTSYRLLVDNGRPRLEFGNNSRLIGKKKINDGKWNHLACLFFKEGTSITFYVNGVVDTSATETSTPSIRGTRSS